MSAFSATSLLQECKDSVQRTPHDEHHTLHATFACHTSHMTSSLHDIYIVRHGVVWLQECKDSVQKILPQLQALPALPDGQQREFDQFTEEEKLEK